MTHFRFLIMSTLIFSVNYCYANQEPRENAPILFSKDGEGTTALKFSYMIEDPKTKIPCTLANMSITIVVNYTTSNNKVATKNVTIPSNAVAEGSCGLMVSTLSLVWGTKDNEKFQQSVVKFLLFNDRINFSVFSAEVDLFLDPVNFPDAADDRRITKSKIDLGLFHAPMKAGQHKYSKEKRIKVDNDTALILTNVSLIAFNSMENYSQWNAYEVPEISFPYPGEPVFNYVVRDPETKLACSFANMTISVKLTYRTKINSEKQTTFAVPKNANVSGNCDPTNSKMTLSWVPESAVVKQESSHRTQNSISLIFSRDEWKFYVTMISVDFYLDENNFPDVSDSMQRRYTMSVDKLNLFKSYIGFVHKCDFGTPFVQFNEVRLTFSDVAITAFYPYSHVSLFTEDNCKLPHGVYILLGMCCFIGLTSAFIIIGIGYNLLRKYRQ